jgi:hypothetical protein
LDVARLDRQVPARLRDLLDRHVEAVLLEDAGLAREGDRREARPPRDADRDLRVLRRGAAADEHRQRQSTHHSVHAVPLVLFCEVSGMIMQSACRPADLPSSAHRNTEAVVCQMSRQ